MIQAYLAANTMLDMNGDSVLLPTSCKLSAKLNGSWQLNLAHPLDSLGRWKYIEENGVISVPSFLGERDRKSVV